MQDCTYVYEYRHPETGRVMFVGHSKGWGAWMHLHDALAGKVSGSAFVALYRYLRIMLDRDFSPEALAPVIVGCLKNRDAILGEVARRLSVYGAENLLNSGNHAAAGAEPIETAAGSCCGAGDDWCLYRRDSASNLASAQRQVGHFARLIPNASNRPGANWRDYPIVNNDDFNRKTEQRYRLEYDPDLGPLGEFCVSMASNEMAVKLSGKDASVFEAQLLAGFIRHLSGNSFFILETNGKGDLAAAHPVMLPPGKFAFAEKVFREAGESLRPASKEKRAKLLLALADGSAGKEFDPTIDSYAGLEVGGKINFVPFVPKPPGQAAPPTPIRNPAAPSEYNPALMDALARMTAGFKGREDDSFVPPPLQAKPEVDEPEVINALARWEALITPHPVILASIREPNIDPSIKDQFEKVAKAGFGLPETKKPDQGET